MHKLPSFFLREAAWGIIAKDLFPRLYFNDAASLIIHTMIWSFKTLSLMNTQ